MGNLDMYNKYKQPPNDALKSFNNGRFSGTDINPMWRIKVLTEEYGECGFGWYSKLNRVWKEESPETREIAVFCEVELYVKRGDVWSAPIVGVGGNTFVASYKNRLQASDEAYKMAYTDALGIACKALGIGADVWWKSPDSKYNNASKPEDEHPAEDAVQPPKQVKRPPASTVPVTMVDPPNSFSLNTAIEGWCKHMHCKKSDFARMRDEAISQGLAQDIPGKDMTPVDFDNLCKAIEKMVGL